MLVPSQRSSKPNPFSLILSAIIIAGIFVVGLQGLPAQAQPRGALIPTEKSATKDGLVIAADAGTKIIVFHPDVQVGEQTTGGLTQPNADWTGKARNSLILALESGNAVKGVTMKVMPDLQGEQAILMASYSSLFKAVSDAIVSHKLFPGDELPSKSNRFDWSLGTGLGKIGGLDGYNYGLFIYLYDSYRSRGFKSAQIVGSLFGVEIMSGVHIGYAGLVDLRSGDIVWINTNIAMDGDVRTEDGAAERVKQLLKNFPIREPANRD